jgi:putative nucleotidyltransferase with HDIG domain
MTSLALGAAEPTVTGAPTARVLVVDDEDTIRVVISRYLRSRGFEVETAETGDIAIDTLARSTFDLMLCDVRMPGRSGLDIVPAALSSDPDLGIVMLSAVNDAPTATQALSHGVLDYLTKPIELAALYDAVSRALHKRTLLREQRRVERQIREEVELRTQELELEKAHLRELVVDTVNTLIMAMEAKDVFQRGHSARVGELAASIADHIGLPADVVEDVRTAGRLHDVGNIGIREDVLNKPGPLSPEEYEHVQDHVRLGVEILSPLRYIDRAVTFVADHHEHWDGTGYPNQKRGEEISIGGRILCAADAFDAMTSKRAWREPMAPEDAVEHLRGAVGTLIDPRVYDALRVIVKRRKSLVFIDAMHA